MLLVVNNAEKLEEWVPYLFKSFSDFIKYTKNEDVDTAYLDRYSKIVLSGIITYKEINSKIYNFIFKFATRCKKATCLATQYEVNILKNNSQYMLHKIKHIKENISLYKLYDKIGNVHISFLNPHFFKNSELSKEEQFEYIDNYDIQTISSAELLTSCYMHEYMIGNSTVKSMIVFTNVSGLSNTNVVKNGTLFINDKFTTKSICII